MARNRRKRSGRRINFDLRGQLTKANLNYPLLYLTIAMLVFGVLMVYSSSAVLAAFENKSTFHYFLLQLAWVGIGTVGAFIAYKLPLKLISKSSVIVMVVSIVLLIAVLIVGKDLNGARRWIDLGPFDLQPSEVAKLGFIIYLSAWLSRKRPSLKSFQDVLRTHFYYDLLPFVFMMGMVCVLIVLQPDLDTTVIIAVTALAIYFISGRDALHTIGTILVLITGVVVGVIATVAAPYRLVRIQTYIQFLLTGDVQDKRDTGFQLWNGLIAIGSGGLFGVGFGESRQKLFYLQNAAFTDSIFSIIAEEFGLIGSGLVIVAFLYFLSLGIKIALKAPDKFSSLLAAGITTWITLQAFLNIGANVALVPFGGIPLPFFSYGGSSTIMVMIAVGLLLNVSSKSKSH